MKSILLLCLLSLNLYGLTLIKLDQSRLELPLDKVSLDQPVSNLKNLLAGDLNMKQEDFILIFKTQLLADANTLGSYGIDPNSEIKMFRRVRTPIPEPQFKALGTIGTLKGYLPDLLNRTQKLFDQVISNINEMGKLCNQALEQAEQAIQP